MYDDHGYGLPTYRINSRDLRPSASEAAAREATELPAHIKTQIADLIRDCPEWGPERISAALHRDGHEVSTDAVRATLLEVDSNA